MAIVVNGVTIPEDGDYIVVNGVKVERVIANDVVTWERKKATPIKNAPPFLSAGWRTYFSHRWDIEFYDEQTNIPTWFVEKDDADSDETRWISENEIRIFHHIPSDERYRGYMFYLSTPIDTSVYSRFSFDVHNDSDDDTSEGQIFTTTFQCCRYSQDGVTWDEYWDRRDTFDKSYKYAQVGYFTGGNNDASTSMWFSTVIKSFTIQ